MSFNEFEDKIRKGIYSDTAEIDAEELWKGIQNKREKRRPIWILLLGAAMGLFLVFVYLKNNPKVWLESEKNIEQTSIVEALISTKEYSVLSRNEEAEDLAAGYDGVTNKESNGATEKQPAIHEKTKEVSSVSKNKVEENSIQEQLENAIHKASSFGAEILSNWNTINDVKSFPNHSLANRSEMQMNEIDEDNHPEGIKNEVKSSAINRNQYKLPRLAQSLSVVVSEEPMKIIDKLETIEMVDLDINDRLKTNRGFWLGVTSGVDLVKRTVQSNPLSDQSKWGVIDERLKPLVNLHAGLDFGIDLSDHFCLRSGIRYNRLVERVEHSWTTTSNIIIRDQVVEEIETSAGLIQVVDDIRVTQTKTMQLAQYNMVNYFEVPLGLEMRSLANMRNVWFSAEIGAAIGFNSSQQGVVFKTDEEIISLDEQTVFKRKFGLSIYGQFSIHKRISNRLNINLSISGKNYLNALSMDDYAYNVRYLFYGTQVGLRYRL